MRDAEAVGADVASAVLRRYASLGKNGKPQPGEYTLLAGFAVTDGDGPPRVVAIGTGTKCLPRSLGARAGKPWRTLTPRSSRDAPSFASRTTSSIVSSRPTDPRDPTRRPSSSATRARSPRTRTPPNPARPSAFDRGSGCTSTAPSLRAETPLSSRDPLPSPTPPSPVPRRPPRRSAPRRRAPGAEARVSPARSSFARTAPTPTPSSASNHRRSARLDSNPDEDSPRRA